MREKSYNRAHLRAPFRYSALFEDEDFVFKADVLNLSEGGMLFDMLPHFPDKEEVSIMLAIPSFPHFKNFTVGRLKDYSQEIYSKKVIRLKGKMVRREKSQTSIDEIFSTRIGVQFSQVDNKAKRVISEYVSTFISNVVHLQALLDNVNSDAIALEKVKALSSILSYPNDLKISLLRKKVTEDYMSLQWL